MCIKAIANFDYEAAKDNLVETVKYLDAGKILGVAGKLLEINPKDVCLLYTSPSPRDTR